MPTLRSIPRPLIRALDSQCTRILYPGKKAMVLRQSMVVLGVILWYLLATTHGHSLFSWACWAMLTFPQVAALWLLVFLRKKGFGVVPEGMRELAFLLSDAGASPSAVASLAHKLRAVGYVRFRDLAPLTPGASPDSTHFYCHRGWQGDPAGPGCPDWPDWLRQSIREQEAEAARQDLEACVPLPPATSRRRL